MKKWDHARTRNPLRPGSPSPREGTAPYIRRGNAAGTTRGPAPVPAVVAVRLPQPADRALVEAVLVRTVRDAAPPISVELAPLQPPAASAPGPAAALTCAVVLRPAGEGRLPDQILADAKRVMKRGLRRTFGPRTRVAVRAARSPATLAACLRAIAGDPRVVHPDEG